MLDDGTRLQALKVCPSSPGKNYVMYSAGARQCESSCGGQPADQGPHSAIIYLGDHVRMMTEVAGQGNFMVKLSAAHIEPHWQPGSEVLLSWMPAHLRALEGVTH